VKRQPGIDTIETPFAASSEIPRVVVVDGDTLAAESLLSIATLAGYKSTRAPTPTAAHDATPRSEAMVLFVDSEAISGRVEQVAHQLRASGRPHQLLVTAADVGARQVLRWIHDGASDVLPKPFDVDEARAALDRAAMRLGCATQATGTATALDTVDLLQIIGSDPRLCDALALARAASGIASTVLIHGESGTGKSMLARAIHERSDRRDGPFIEIACGSIPEALLESELFGHIKGSFTGAIADRKGRFLAANGGTIFLDEINSAPPAMQLKLLRVLQEHRFEPVGSEESVNVDVRVIVASNQSLEQLVDEGRFRQDLYYRVQVIAIGLPPLRERPADVEALALHFLARKATEARRTYQGFTPEAMQALRDYHWPGNVRDLENAIERAVVLGRDSRIGVADLPERVLRSSRPPASRGATGEARNAQISDQTSDTQGRDPGSVNPANATEAGLCQMLRTSERQRIIEALDGSAGNRTHAARRLGIDRSTLYRKMIDLGLAAPRDRGRAA